MNEEIILTELKGLRELFNEKFENNEKCHETMLIQVTKTNARVSGLENWKNKIIGALVMTNIIILPILFMLIQNWLEK